jgi:hypothetical protein
MICSSLALMQMHSGWHDENCGPFVISMPPGMESIPAHGIDSFCGEFKSATIDLGFDWGPWSDNLVHWPSKASIERISFVANSATASMRNGVVEVD